MRVLKAIAIAIALAGIIVHTAPPAQANEDLMEDKQAVEKAVDQWIVVLNAMLNGDPEPLADLYSHADDTYYMGAEGSYRTGWDAIYGDWKTQAGKSSGGEVRAVDVHVVVFGDTAMAAHFTRGKVRMPDGKMDDNNVRETSVFRKEDGVWRMVGHHADGLAYWEKAFDD